MKNILKMVASLFLCTTLLFSTLTITQAKVSNDEKTAVIDTDETWTNKTFNGDVYILENVTLTTSGNSTISGNVYVFGTLSNTGFLKVSGTLNCLNYSSGGFSFSAGDYKNGILKSTGRLQITTLNVKDDYLTVNIPTIDDSTTTPPTTNDSTLAHTHTFSDWETIKSSTCTASGERQKTCYKCGYTIKESIKPIGHIWYDWEITRDPSALAKGIKQRTCSICQKIENATIPKLKAKVKLQKTKLSLKKKKTYTLKIKSKTYGDKISKWKSNKPKVASVSSKGKIKAKKKGTAKITLYMKSGVKATCTVKVK